MAKEEHRVVSRRLTTRISLLISLVVVLSVIVYSQYNSQVLRAHTESEVLNEARTLSLQMQAAWDYIDQSQDSINYNSDGRFDFKGIYCSIAGKNIAQNFTRASEGYMIRYARNNPRSYTDVPDPFEAAALEAFEAGSAAEYYQVAEYEGRPVFRYASMLQIKRNCLTCHGQERGDFDITGFTKEGMALGDVAGAVSIVIPLDTYQSNAQERNLSDTLFYVWLVVAVALCIYLAIRVWVARPLTKMNRELVVANEASSTFLMTMSHEMRTPILSIMAYTDLLEDAADVGASAGGAAEASVGMGAGTFLMTMSHEMRTPILSIMAYTDLLEDAADVGASAGGAAEASVGMGAGTGEAADSSDAAEASAGDAGRLAEAVAAGSAMSGLSGAATTLPQEPCGGSRSPADSDAAARNARYIREIRENSRQLLSMVNNVIDATTLPQEPCGGSRSPADSDAAARNARYIREIRENSRQLLSMVNNVIDAARIEANAFTVTYDAVDVADLVQAALLPIQPLAAQRGVRIESRVGPVPVLSADWDALFKILSNLVGNAVKFSNDGGAVRVLVSYDSSAARLSIVVEDEGVGIEPAHLETIFDRFAQAPREEQGRPTGSGLGLFLVRALSEAMGGSATVESELGRGSRFTVIVPAQVAECLNE